MNEVNSVIRINSEDVDANGTFSLGNPMSNATNIYAIVTWQQTDYNIPSPASFYVDAVAYIVPSGFYTQQSICSILGTLLGSGFTVAPNAYSKKITIASVASANFTINGTLCDLRLMDLLGFGTVTYTGASTYTAPSVGSGGYKGNGMSMVIKGLNRIDNCDIFSRNPGTLMFVPCVGFGITGNYQHSSPQSFVIDKTQKINYLNITFVDFYGQKINFNGGSWVVELVCIGPKRDRF
jgi:hypothetical protein